jgi:hypothetical protein
MHQATLGARGNHIPGCPDDTDATETLAAYLDSCINPRRSRCFVGTFDVVELDLLQPASVQQCIESQANVTGLDLIRICGLS